MGKCLVTALQVSKRNDAWPQPRSFNPVISGGAERGSVAFVIKRQNFPKTALHRSDRTDHSCQRRKLVGERHGLSAIDCELALADHVDQLDAGEQRAGGVE